ncbi:hypothetical protein FHT78_000567 [Rhizobium sp. BK196]|jgi:hypothetical protein|uniref:hypothetical protein n=1 Tax=Rhizobium sp. BK196 TaxID=2587073 RepID=UPI001614AE4B|nr:hypothetical protein [Rhizobium sp. BK196]MBB3308838.1 hypothetical protein [Rhizobium sp. BK196]
MKAAVITGVIAGMVFSGASLAQSASDTSPPLPDYVATMQSLDKNGVPIDPTTTVIHHDGMFRSETRWDGLTSFGYGPDRKDPVLRWSRQTDGEITQMELIGSGQKLDATVADVSRPLAERSTVAGQDCLWRETVEKAPPLGSIEPGELNCVTDDGIVIETKLLAGESVPIYHTRLASLERRAVTSSELRPPQEILSPDFWLRPIRSHEPDPSRPDFEMTLESPAGINVRLLRHFPWRYEESRGRNGTIHTIIQNELDDQGIWYRQSSGDRRITAWRSSERESPSVQAGQTTGKVSLGKTDTILGETCEWFDLVPHETHGENQACLTQDGIPLKEEVRIKVSTTSYTATSFRRRPVDFSEMRLPSALFPPAEWGLPALQ